MSTSLVYVLPSIMFGQMLAARKETQPPAPTNPNPSPSPSPNPSPNPDRSPTPNQDKSRVAQLELLGSRLITVLGVFMVAVGMKAAF